MSGLLLLLAVVAFMVYVALLFAAAVLDAFDKPENGWVVGQFDA